MHDYQWDLSTPITAGNYALICFVPDSADGKPHALHGMVKEFTVQ
jgi:hypothetical protein